MRDLGLRLRFEPGLTGYNDFSTMDRHASRLFGLNSSRVLCLRAFPMEASFDPNDGHSWEAEWPAEISWPP